MLTWHRKKAFLGAAGWVVFLLAFVTLLILRYTNRNNEGSPSYVCLTWWSVLLMTACFFWACYHLAKAKGYSGAVCLFGLMGPPAQIAVLTGLLVMEDKHSNN